MGLCRKFTAFLHSNWPLILLCSTFENKICQKSKLLDFERTDEMARDEQDIVEELQRIKMEISNEHFSQFPNSPVDAWVSKYVEKIKPRIQEQVTWAYGYVKCYKLYPTPQLHDEIHAQRRRIAVMHQDVYLTEQGLDIPALVVHLNESIACGYR